MSDQAEVGAVGVIIRGCPDPEGATLINPVLWCTNDIQSISGATGNLTTAVMRGRIKKGEAGVDGFVHQVTLQDPLGQGTTLKIRLMDEPLGTVKRDLAQLFSPDPSLYATSSWQVKTSTVHLPKASVSIDLVGPLPTVNQIIWIENEALQITAVVANLANASYTVTVTRGVLGSRAREHTIKPAFYPPGDGQDVGLMATSRPDFDNYGFETEIWLFTMDGTTATPLELWPRMTDGRPVQEGSGVPWVVSTLDLAGALQKKQTKRPSIKLSHAITVRSVGGLASATQGTPTNPDGYSAAVSSNSYPQLIRVWFTPYEAEKHFNRRFRLPFNAQVSTADVAAFNSRLTAYPAAGTKQTIEEFVLKNGGYEWTYRVSSIGFVAPGPDWNTSLGRQYIYADAFLWSASQESGSVASVMDKPCPGYPETKTSSISVNTPNLNLFVGPGFSLVGTIAVGQLTNVRRPPTLNMGWSWQDQDRIRIELGETNPEIKRRVWLSKVRPVQAILMLLLSGNGGGVNDTVYDQVCGELCAETDSAFLNLGATSATPLTTDPRTSELLKLDQLLGTLETIPLDCADFDLGKELRRLLRVNSLITAYVAGGMTFRQLAGPLTATPATVQQVTGRGKLVEVGGRLPAMKSLTILGGHHPVTLKPGWAQLIGLYTGVQVDPGPGDQISVYPSGGAITPDQWLAGPLSQLIRVTFLLQRGSPPVYKVPTKRQRGAIYTGDIVSWSGDTSIVGPNGRGSSPNRNNRWLVVGRDVNSFKGDQHIYLTSDNIGDLQTVDGAIGMAYRCDRIGLNAAGHWCVVAKTFSGAGFFDPLDILINVRDNAGYVRVICEDVHNPQTGDVNTRPGYLETYGQILSFSVEIDKGSDGQGVFELAISAAWTALGFTPANMIEGRTFLVMTDYRSQQSNPEGVEIGPVDAAANTQAIIGPGDGNPATSRPWGGVLTEFDS